MASFEAHCEQCVKEMGEAIAEVHLCLDAFFGQAPCGTMHKHLRYHLEGIAEVRRKWGDKAAIAAEIHIRPDLEGEGYAIQCTDTNRQ